MGNGFHAEWKKKRKFNKITPSPCERPGKS